ncbi:magnesium and cobalt transport protein CorA [Brachybacterium aquaticum]|uniref:Magnesium transporter n=1 Tax=Brachybacterium aquaticum TaxID=1432564 RepID=A0A841AGF6_9MICO|nr:magnesium and cobalt transport protein CorA [Brachybacterium aquaticum]MBB5833007.1 magnesium transporter [Brachybacterium aquaticum]
MAIRRPRPTVGPTPEPTPEPGSDALIRYVQDGVPSVAPTGTSAGDALEFAASAPDRMAMFFYPQPRKEDVLALGEAWDLHPVLMEDLLTGRQRPKFERYGDVRFLVLRSARYDDAREEIDVAEFHVLLRPGAVAVLCQDGRWIDGTASPELDADHPLTSTRRERSMPAGTNLLTLGPEAVVYRVLDVIVDGYEPVLRGLLIDKEQIERQVFGADAAVTERIYRLSQEVVEMQQIVTSLEDVIEALRGGFDKYAIPEALQAYLDDVSDHLTRAIHRVAELREALTQILSVNATLVAQRQNEDMKKISGWAAILFAPTLIGAIYGMNFDHMPELHWAFGYPMALGMMLGLGVLLYVVFKKLKWM